MPTVLIACALALAAYLAKRLWDANTENAALRTQIALLKRQLGRARR